MSRKTAAMLIPTILTLTLAGLMLGAHSGPGGGGTPYTPTQGEWLCVLLNMDEAAAADVQFPTGTGVRFRHDHTKPDTIQIELLYNVNVPESELRHRAQHAERQAQEVAKLKGWEGWLRTEVTQTKVTRRPVASPLDE
jgi:hypothetical protein